MDSGRKIKTIFITAYHGFVARALFDSAFLDKLRGCDDVRVVIFVAIGKKKFFEDKYGAPNIIIEEFDLSGVIRSRVSKVIYRLGFVIQNSTYNQDQREERLFRNKNRLTAHLNYLFVSSISMLLSKIALARSVYRWINMSFSGKNHYSPFFVKYNPELAFSTDIFSEFDNFFIKTADALGVKTIGMVRSWDNPTTKGTLRWIPDIVLVNTEITKNELIKYHDVPNDNIKVVGLPQFDKWYVGPTMSKEQFFIEIGAEVSRPLLIFAPAGEGLTDIDWQICEILRQALDNKKFTKAPQFLIRNHPAHPANLKNFKPDNNFIIEYPGTRFAEGYRGIELSPDENIHLRNSIFYSDMILYIATSMGLDALVYNKPSIIINFDGWESHERPRSVKRYNDEDCLRNFVKDGGALLANSPDELVDLINQYLENPDWRSDIRKLARARYLYNPDGRAGERMADIVLSMVL